MGVGIPRAGTTPPYASLCFSTTTAAATIRPRLSQRLPHDDGACAPPAPFLCLVISAFDCVSTADGAPPGLLFAEAALRDQLERRAGARGTHARGHLALAERPRRLGHGLDLRRDVR